MVPQEKIFERREYLRLDQLLKGKYGAVLASIFISCLVFWHFQKTQYRMALVWFLINFGSNLLRILVLVIYNELIRLELKKKYWLEYTYAFCLSITGLTWGITPFVFLSHATSLEAIFLIFMTYGILTGGLSASGHSIKVSWPFALSIIIPYTIYAINIGGEIGLMMALASLPFLAIVLKSSHTYNKFIVQTLDFSLKNEKYAQELAGNIKLEKELNLERAKNIQNSKLMALGEMSAGIAHEINNPLSIITGNARIIKNMAGKEKIDKEQLYKKTNMILRTAQRIASIIKSLKTISRDGAKDEKTYFEPQTLIEDVTIFCTERFKTHSINFLVKDNLKENIVIHGKIIELSQVIINLLNNAFDAIKDFDEKWVELHLNKVNQKLVISVIDSGKGIPADLQEKIIEPFFTTKDAGHGTGLGLSISTSILENHGGKLSIDSNYHHTKFDITLPIA